jgi:hypothetical protein
MRRLIIGAVALASGALAALGVGLGVRRRRGRHDDVLPLDPVPLLSAVAAPAAEAEVASIEADFGAVEAASPAPKRRRPRRKKPAAPDAGGGTESSAAAATTADRSPGTAATAASEETAPAPKRRRPRRKPAATGPAEGAEAPDAS